MTASVHEINMVKYKREYEVAFAIVASSKTHLIIST